jgi:tripartite-type tricarboxylate transporter receptor subunit TctC
MQRRHLPALLAALPLPALAQPRAWPDRPIRLIVPAPPGGTTDIWGRIAAQGMTPLLGQPVIVENRAGAGGMIGAQAVAQAVPDGLTLLYHIDALVTTPITQRQSPYDVQRDFAPLGRLGGAGTTFSVGPSVPAGITTMMAYLEWARGQSVVALGNWSAGGSGHAFAVLMEREGRLANARHIAYRGEAPLVQDILSGTVHGGFASMLASRELIMQGRLRPLASAGPNRAPSLADRVPTMLELGFSQRFGYQGWHGLLAPARTPEAIQAKLADTFRTVANSPEVMQRARDMDVVHRYEGPADFAATIRRTHALWSQITEELDLYQSAG